MGLIGSKRSGKAGALRPVRRRFAAIAAALAWLPLSIISLPGPLSDQVEARPAPEEVGREPGLARPLMIEPRRTLETAGNLAAAEPAEGWRLLLSRMPVLSGPLTAIIAAISCGLALVYVRRSRRALDESQAEAWRLSNSDPVTGTANRLFFFETLDEEIRQPGSKLVLLLIEIDRFRELCESLGQEAADRIAALLVERVAERMGPSDMLARLAGGEFALLHRLPSPRLDAEALAQKILRATEAPFDIDGRQVALGLFIGGAYHPEDGRERDEWLRAAHAALRRARETSDKKYVFCDGRMREALRSHKNFADDMRVAIRSDVLILQYEPVWTTDGKRMVGVEASVAWQKAENGILSPEEFARFTEEAGLTMAASEWILRRACLDGLRWPGLQIAVNVMPAQLRHGDFIGLTRRVLRETGFPPGRLEFDVSEQLIVASADAAEAGIVGLRKLGVRSALDDFGTGSASLIHLRRFDFDKVKLDRSFFAATERPGESTIVAHAAAHLARALGLTVAATGVETAAEHRFLQAVGCEEMQGSLFGQAVPAAEIDGLIELDIEPARKIA